jgi:hypothetical protein
MFRTPDVMKLYLPTDMPQERTEKIQYYDACLKYGNGLSTGNVFHDIFYSFKRPPRMHWQMDAQGKEKEIARWKKNGWYTELRNASEYMAGNSRNAEVKIDFRLGDVVETPFTKGSAFEGLGDYEDEPAEELKSK